MHLRDAVGNIDKKKQANLLNKWKEVWGLYAADGKNKEDFLFWREERE